jgi:hypothetical protein
MGVAPRGPEMLAMVAGPLIKSRNNQLLMLQFYVASSKYLHYNLK